MHVAVDAVGNHTGGGWSVLVRTVAELAADPRISTLTVFCSPLKLGPSGAPESAKIRWAEREREHRLVPARLGWFHAGLDSECARVGADVVLSLNGVGQTARPRVNVVQQAFLVTGQLTRLRPRSFAARIAVLRREARRSAQTAARIVVQTSWMRGRVWESWGREATVLPLGLPRAQPRAAASRAPASIAVVGSDLPYKRRDIAFAALELARRHAPHLEMTTVSDASPAAVSALLGRATMLLHPADVESFGLPVVEAFAAGCPVVLPRLPWARAVAADAGLMFDAGSPSSAARRLLDGLASEDLLDDQRAAGYARLQALWGAEPYRGLVDLLLEIA